MRARMLTLAIFAGLAASASAQAPTFGSEKRPLVSDNVSLVTTIPIGKPIGARFRDDYMYVTGTEGLEIYNVAVPEQPVLTGALPLPHFENEDVDLAGDILLISNDPSEGVGVLYVVDISNPALPVLKSALFNGIIDAAAEEALTILGVPGEVSGLTRAGIGHTASCVTADCSWAYLAGTSKGITVVDLRNPAEPKIAGGFVPDITGLATHDVQVDANGIAWIVGNNGTAGYDVSNPLEPRQVFRSDEAVTWSGEVLPGIENDVFNFPENTAGLVGYGEGAIDLVHHNSLRLGTLAKPPAGQTPAPGGAPVVPETPAGGGGGGGSSPNGTTTIAIQPENQGSSATPLPPDSVARANTKAKRKALRRCAKLRKAKRRKACRAKVRRRFARRAQTRAAAGGGGSLVLEAFAQKPGKTYPAGGDSPLFGVVEEDYNRPTCQGAGSFQLWGETADRTSKGAAKLGLLDSYSTELAKLVNGQSGWAPLTGLCSAHYFDYRDGIVAGGWYEEGTRFLDVRDPTNIKQIGYWVPVKGETWSVLFPPTDPTGTIVYALDFARGIDVLKLDRTDMRERVQAPVRRSWLTGKGSNGRSSRTGLTIRSRYGYVCRLPVGV